MQTTRIFIKDHVAEYASMKYKSEGDRVKFPVTMDISFLIADLLIKRPANVYRDEGNIEIELPSLRCGKRIETYNYISTRGAAKIADRLEKMMWADFHAFVDQKKTEEGMAIIDAIHLFMCKYGIDSLSEDAFQKNYYRWRTAVRQYNKRGYKRKSA